VEIEIESGLISILGVSQIYDPSYLLISC